jgi:hypothetical protein
MSYYGAGNPKMTDEERAVIEAAEAIFRHPLQPHADAFDLRASDHNRMVAAVRALRESRQPRPRWGVVSTGSVATLCYGAEMLTVSGDVAAISALSEMFNREAERAEP